MRTALSKIVTATLLTAGIIGVFHSASISAPLETQSDILIATAYTRQALPTLKVGDGGREVEMLQNILLGNGFLGAAGNRLGILSGVVADRVFGIVTEAAIKD